jgi:acetyl esterase
VVSAEYDVLRDEAEAYGARMAGEGVAVEVRRWPGMVHGFFGLPGFFDQADEVRAYVADRLRKALEP